jgi:acyl-CoA reductase-like NAD-dependent aldehyde dehydrogenase
MSSFELTSPLTLTIGGEAVPGEGLIDVINPATGAPFARMPAASRAQLDAAFAAADKAFGDWSSDEDRRRKVLVAMADAVEAATEEIVVILTAEQGKPLHESRRELGVAVAWLRYYAGLEVAPEVLRDDSEARAEVVRRPLGVVAAIAPFNFPVFIGMAKVAPALRAGNTVVLKPSPYTPLSTLRVGEILRDIVPAGALNIVSGSDELGPMMTTHPLTRAITFTGSTGVGRKIAAAAVADFKRLVLEMGGNDPAIVLDDVDVDYVADQLFARGFNNNGQACVAAKRIYVPKSLRPAIVDALADRARAAKVGDGFRPDTQLGPLNNAPQRDRVVDLVDEAVAKGASVAAGGHRIDGPGYFYEPTILSGLSDGVRVVDEEQFGPVLPIVEYDDVEDAVRRANSGKFGLGGSVWGGDTERAAAIAQRLDTGSAWVNTHTAMSTDFPFGGAKWSGLGIEGGRWGIEGVTDPQMIYTAKATGTARS